MIGAKKIRLEQGYSIVEAAAISGVPRTTISCLERGKMAFTQERVDALAKAYQCEPDALLFQAIFDGRPPRLRRRRASTYRKIVPSVCAQCGVLVSEHPMCYRCEVLIHMPDEKHQCNCGVQHAVMKTRNLCTLCHHDLESVLGRITHAYN